MTPAITVLERAGVSHVIHEYDVPEEVGDGYGRAVAAAIGVDPSTVFKTLLGQVDDEAVVAIVPVAHRLSLKKLASLAGGKKGVMGDPADAERLTGYVPGGISPFGQRRSLRTFLDDSAVRHPLIFVSGGKRGIQVGLVPSELVALTDAVVGPLT